MKNSDKILTDAKAAASDPITFGLETGQAPLDDAHTAMNAAAGTDSLYDEATLDDESR